MNGRIAFLITSNAAIYNILFCDIDDNDWQDVAWSAVGESHIVSFYPATQQWDRNLIDADSIVDVIPGYRVQLNKPT